MMRSLNWLVLLLCTPTFYSWSTEFFVSTTGSDSNPGTFDKPFLTIAKAVGQSSTVFKPGDTVLIRGGIYPLSATLSLSKVGTSTSRYYLLAYPDERPILDCSAMALGSRGITLRGNYWHIRGIDVKGAGDNGMNISGSYNIVEHCAFFENCDTGLQLGGGASYNQIINCDSYYNVDPSQGNADGFAPKLDVGRGNSFFGCRAWQNSDDGWDGYLRGANDVSTTLENCWCFANGYLKDGTASAGNGNGYKLGGSDTKDLMHDFLLKRCLAFGNRVKGFDQNNNRGSMTLYHCTGHNNGTHNYAIADTLAYSRGKTLIVKNCAALGSYGTLSAAAVQQTNSWMSPFKPVTVGEFLSIDTTGMRGLRKPDGSLPDLRFLVPAPGSQLIDTGTDIGLPFSGKGPDVGAFETIAITQLEGVTIGVPEELRVLQSYPNPFNMSTTISYVLPTQGQVHIGVYDVLGRFVRELLSKSLSPGNHTAQWDGRDERAFPVGSGVYVIRVEFRGVAQATTATLVK